jgi:hypothetical protein
VIEAIEFKEKLFDYTKNKVELLLESANAILTIEID